MNYEQYIYHLLKENCHRYSEKIQKEFCSNPPTYHDILEHSEFVRDIALKMGENLGADIDILRASALLHDIGITVEESEPHALKSAKIAKEILGKTDFPKEKMEDVLYAISVHSDLTEKPIDTLEARILWDADKIAHLGAIGLVRFLMRIAMKGGNTKKVLKFFQENLKTAHLLKAKMKTELGKKIAEQRYEFAEDFVEELEKEIGQRINMK